MREAAPPRTPSPPAGTPAGAGAAAPVGGGAPACGEAVRACPWCGRSTRPVFVHGHLQCDRCGTNVDPCCGGETAS